MYRNDSLSEIADLIKPGSFVLLIGPADTSFHALLVKRFACTVDALAFDIATAEMLSRCARKVLVSDPTEFHVSELFPEDRYDYVLATEILVKVTDPGGLLSDLKCTLNDAGRLILAVSAVSDNGGGMTSLIEGLPYTQDHRTTTRQSRFYTRNSLLHLIDHCGLWVERYICLHYSLCPVATSEEDNACRTSLRRYKPSISDTETGDHVIVCYPPKRPLAFPSTLQQYFDRILYPITSPSTDVFPVVSAVHNYTIIIPIYNAFADVERCIESVLLHTESRHQILLLNDYSTDPRIDASLKSWPKQYPQVKVHTNLENLGFVSTVNEGLRISRGDIVILNSDTLVGPGWLDRMDRCAGSSERIGIVCPLSNDATILTIPIAFSKCLPTDAEIRSMTNLVSDLSGRHYPRLPTAVGFCMLLKRALVDAIGGLDVIFSPGYGEECDYSMRAWQNGFEIACCDDAFVYHAGSASFGNDEQIIAIRRENNRWLNHRWPTYHAAVDLFRRYNPLLQLQTAAQAEHDAARSGGACHVLFVLHQIAHASGTDQHVMDVAESLSTAYRSTILIPVPDFAGPGSGDLRVIRNTATLRVLGLSTEASFEAPSLLNFNAAPSDRLLDARFARFLAGSDAHVVHFQHLANWGSLALPVIAKLLGKRVIFSLHDYFLLCPDYQMLSPRMRQCGKTAIGTDDPDCLACIRFKSAEFSDMTDGAVKAYIELRAIVANATVDAVDIFVAPSEHVKNAYLAAFGQRIARKLRVLSHGMPTLLSTAPNGNDSALKIGFLGAFSIRKGGQVFLTAANILGGHPHFQFHVFGPVEPVLEPLMTALNITQNGVYRRDDLPRLLAHIDLLVIPSIFAETFCLTLEEAMALRIPTIASSAGAITERIRDGVNGFLFPPGDGAALASKIKWISENKGCLVKIRRRLEQYRIKSCRDNAQEYEVLYREEIDRAGDGVAFIPAFFCRDQHTLLPELKDLLCHDIDCGRENRALGSKEYRRWLKRSDHARMLVTSSGVGPSGPIFHLIIRAIDFDAPLVRQTLAAVGRQVYRQVFVSVVCDSVEAVESLGEFDGVPVHWIPAETRGGWKRAVNLRVAETTGDWIALLHQGDWLDEKLLLVCVQYLECMADWQLFYTDSDLHDERGGRYAPSFKPDINLELLRSAPYLEGFCTIRRDVLLDLGGYPDEESVEHQSIALRLMEAQGSRVIGHIPEMLFGRLDRVEKKLRRIRLETSAKAVGKHFSRLGRDAVLQKDVSDGVLRIRYRHRDTPRVSVCILANHDAVRLKGCLSSIVDHLGYRNIELIILAPAQSSGEMARYLALLSAQTTITVLTTTSDLPPEDMWQNLTERTSGEFLWFLDDDVEIVQPGILDILLEQGMCPDVGVVGCSIVNSRGTTIDGARILGGGRFGVTSFGFPTTTSNLGLFDRASVAQDVSAVSSSCLLIGRYLFTALGGFDTEHYGVALSSIDLCLRARESGKRIIWTPYVSIRRKHAADTDCRHLADEEATSRFWMRWHKQLGNDPAFNRHLSLLRCDGTPEVEVDVPWDPILRNRPRVMAFPYNDWGSGHYRVRGPLRALSESGRAEFALMPDHKVRRVPTPAEVARAEPDVLLMQNTLHDFQLDAMERYRKLTGVKIVYGQDDLLTQLPPKNPFTRTNYKDIGVRIERAARLADRVVVSTAPLAEHFRPFVDDVRVIPNRLERSRWEGLQIGGRGGRRPRVGWAGAPQHLGDLELLAEVVEQTSDEVDWIFLGMCPEFLLPYAKESHPMVPFDQYPTTLASLALDLAVAPLVVCAFNEAKSNLKLLEYGILGLPVVCTDILPYQGAPVKRVPNKAKAWVENIRDLVYAPCEMHAQGDSLRAWVRAGYLLEEHLNDWENALFE